MTKCHNYYKVDVTQVTTYFIYFETLKDGSNNPFAILLNLLGLPYSQNPGELKKYKF